LEFRAAIEYNPWENLGMGLGFDALKLKLEANGEDYPSIDFKGDVESSTRDCSYTCVIKPFLFFGQGCPARRDLRTVAPVREGSEQKIAKAKKRKNLNVRVVFIPVARGGLL
jgi:hypothetical protein